MKNLTAEQWVQLNQQYLMASIHAVKTELIIYQSTCRGKAVPEKDRQALSRAKKKLSNLKESMPVESALSTLTELFHLSDFESKILVMCAGMELDTSLANLVSDIQVNSSLQMPTINLALAAFENAHWSAITPEGPLRYWHLINMSPNQMLTSSSCFIDEYILHYLTGIKYTDHKLKDYISIVVSEGGLADSHTALAKRLSRFLSKVNPSISFPLFHLTGNHTEDKIDIAAQAFKDYNFTVYRMPIQQLPSNLRELSEIILYWNRMAALNRGALYLDGSQLNPLDQNSKYLINHLVENIQGIVVLGSAQKINGTKRGQVLLEVQKPLQKEQQLLWEHHLGPAGKTINGLLGQISMQFHLDTHSIKYLSRLAVSLNNSNGSQEKPAPDIQKQIWTACCNLTRPNLEQLAQRIESKATWDDLVLPDMQKSVLADITVQLQQRHKVYHEWGFARKSNRGLGISALFSGQSGTGKTMAAEVLANEMQLDLFRIDLSQVVNKYIGETEKNLKKVFDAAEGSGAILLFDEADALFGKRSEVKDSHDRYSNIEVSFLLQKMEEYRGLAILTTNLKNALDKAFLRRIRFVVQFPFPDQQMRAEIWKRVFPKQTPTKELNINRLAALNIAGGNIRNIALNASFLAAGNNQPVSMQDIQQAARNEYLKLEKHMSSAESLL